MTTAPPPTPPTGVETDLGWTLFAVVRRYRHLTDDLLTDLPGGPRGYQVLMTAEHGGPRNQLALAHYLGVDRTVMTYLLDELEAAGLIERKPDPADRRARRIELTTVGTAALMTARHRLETAETTLLATLEPGQRDALRTLLYQLATSGDQSQPAPGNSGQPANRKGKHVGQRRRSRDRPHPQP